VSGDLRARGDGENSIGAAGGSTKVLEFKSVWKLGGAGFLLEEI
jgi:hypothetical protein